MEKETKTKSEAIKEAEQTLKELQPKQHFVIIYESFYKNRKLTGDEIALFTYLLTRSPNYKPSKRSLMANLDMSERAILRASKGLQEKGYLYIENKGMKGKIWTITQTPIETAIYNDDKESILLFNEPTNVIELLERGTITKEQAEKRIIDYISALKTKHNLNLDELIEIARHNWLDD